MVDFLVLPVVVNAGKGNFAIVTLAVETARVIARIAWKENSILTKRILGTQKVNASHVPAGGFRRMLAKVNVIVKIPSRAPPMAVARAQQDGTTMIRKHRPCA